MGALDEAFFAHLEQPLPKISQSTLWQRPTTARGLIVAGPAAPSDAAAYAGKVFELSTRLGWPVLADGLSPVRNYAPPGRCVVTEEELAEVEEEVRNRIAWHRRKFRLQALTGTGKGAR